MNAVVATKEDRQLAPYQAAIQKSQERFLEVAASSVNYKRESMFALQALMKTDFAMQVANKNPVSVQMAMINVASTGLTLNPANGYAYLVPRDRAIHLDISYKGLIKIATDTGSIEWARADVVYERDSFAYHGPAALPEHTANPFNTDRGEIIGVYCIAKTHAGDILTEVMDRAEIDKVRSKSMAKSGPWVDWFVQMCKKAVIKRASKTWPYTEQSGRIDQAIEIANTSEGGYDLESEEEKLHKRRQQHDAALGRHFRSVEAIKEALAAEEPDMHSVAEMWGEIPQEDQMALWLAPTKGGYFTTAERAAIKNGVPKATNETEEQQ
ncbi:recombinase RecT [Stenotrophomonas sp. 59]|uniref:recombinase RecT n=1 Tax=Stenotrophomonas sp. 59 TaxID=3051120 RepID=UPI00256F3DF5|nr:recombinase RecT [Stenotrophomonas sp. 59]